MDVTRHLVGVSDATKALQQELEEAARSDAKVLITGESGVGKEIAGQMIHHRSPRRHGPLVTINCAGMPDSLLDAMFPAGSAVQPMARFFRFERDAVRLHVRAYGFPALAPTTALDTVPRFLLLARDASLPRGYKNVELFGRVVFPRYRVLRLRDNLSLFTRTDR